MLVRAEVVGHKGRFEFVVGLDEQRGPEGVEVLVVIVAPRREVARKAVALMRKRSETHGNRFSERDIDHPVQLGQVEIAELSVDLAFELGLGALGSTSTAPPVMFRPNNVPCTPLSTCTDWMSYMTLPNPYGRGCTTSPKYVPTGGSVRTCDSWERWPRIAKDTRFRSDACTVMASEARRCR